MPKSDVEYHWETPQCDGNSSLSLVCLGFRAPETEQGCASCFDQMHPEVNRGLGRPYIEKLQDYSNVHDFLLENQVQLLLTA